MISIEKAIELEVKGLQQDASRALAQNNQTIHELQEALASATRASADLEQSLAQAMDERDEARSRNAALADLAAVLESRVAGSHLIDAWKVLHLFLSFPPSSAPLPPHFIIHSLPFPCSIHFFRPSLLIISRKYFFFQTASPSSLTIPPSHPSSSPFFSHFFRPIFSRPN